LQLATAKLATRGASLLLLHCRAVASRRKYAFNFPACMFAPQIQIQMILKG